MKQLICLAKVKVKVAQSCLTLCNPVDYTVLGMLQPRILEWIHFPFSMGSAHECHINESFGSWGRARRGKHANITP